MWEEAAEMAKRHEPGNSHWLRLTNDGDNAVLVLLGEPYAHDVCFVDGKYAAFDNKLRAEGRRPSLRIALNVALYDTKEVEISECVRAARTEGGQPDRTELCLTPGRRGLDLIGPCEAKP